MTVYLSEKKSACRTSRHPVGDPASWDGGPLFVKKAHHRGKRGGVKTAPPEIGKIVVPAEPWQMGSQLEAIERRAVQKAPPPTLYGLPAGQASV